MLKSLVKTEYLAGKLITSVIVSLVIFLISLIPSHLSANDAFDRYEDWTITSRDDFAYDASISLYGLSVLGLGDNATLILGSNEDGEGTYRTYNYPEKRGFLTGTEFCNYIYLGQTRKFRIIFFGGERQNPLNPSEIEYLDEAWTTTVIYSFPYGIYQQIKPEYSGALWPDKRSRHADAYFDSNPDVGFAHEMYIFGGINETGALNDFWKGDITEVNTSAHIAWSNIGINGLPALYDHSMECAQYDAEKKILIFGGKDGSGTKSNNLYEYNINTDTFRAVPITGVSPEARYGHMTAWDSKAKVMYLFGGQTGEDSYKNDLWAYNPINETWIQIKENTGVTARAYGGMGFSRLKNEIYITSGKNSSGNVNDFWIADNVNYTFTLEILKENQYPISRHGAAACYIDTEVYGGLDNLFKGNFYIFGGQNDSTGQYINNAESIHYEKDKDGNDAWENLPPYHSYQEGRKNHCAAFDVYSSENARDYRSIIMIGGQTDTGTYSDKIQTSNYNGGNVVSRQGIDLSNPALDAELIYGVSVFYPPIDNIVFYGGKKGDAPLTVSGDIFRINLYNWFRAQIDTTNLKTAEKKYGHTMVYADYNNNDLDDGKILVFGGKNDYNATLPKLSEFSVRLVSPYIPDGILPKEDAPEPRIFHSAVFDKTSKTMIVFGGQDGNEKVSRDLMIFYPDPLGGPGTWETIAILPSVPEYDAPKARYKHTAVWDDQNSRMIVFGGIDESGDYLNDIWYYFPYERRWERKPMQGDEIIARAGHTATWDEVQKRMVIFGGESKDKNNNIITLNDTVYFMQPNTRGFFESEEYDIPGNWTFDQISITTSTTTEYGRIAIWIAMPDEVNGGWDYFNRFGVKEADDLNELMTRSLSLDDYCESYLFSKWQNIYNASSRKTDLFNYSRGSYSVEAESIRNASKIKIVAMLQHLNTENIAPVLDEIKLDFGVYDLTNVTAEVEGVDVFGGTAPRGSRTPFAQIKLKADKREATWSSTTLYINGSFEAISSVEVWSSQDETFSGDASDDLLGYVDVAGRWNTITFTTPEEVDTEENIPIYFISANIKNNEDAVPGEKIWIRVTTMEGIGIDFPGQMQDPNTELEFPFKSPELTIKGENLSVSVETSDDTKPGTVLQGEKTVRLFRITMEAINSGDDWKNVKLKSVNIDLEDFTRNEDVSMFKLYAADTNGDFVKNDTVYLLGSASPKDKHAEIITNLSNKTEINSTPKVFYITADIYAGAQYLDDLKFSIKNTSFNYDGDWNREVISTTLPQTCTIDVEPTNDILEIRQGYIAKHNSYQGTENFIVGGFSCGTDKNEAIINSIGIKFIGDADRDNDIGLIKIFKGNEQGSLDPSPIQTITNFDTNGEIEFNFNNIGQAIGTQTEYFYITYDIDLFADEKEIGMEITTIEVEYPDAIEMGSLSLPFNCETRTILDAEDKLIIDVNQVFGEEAKVGSKVRVAKITLRADRDKVKLKRILFNTKGTADIGSDIAAIEIWDEFGNEVQGSNIIIGNDFSFEFDNGYIEISDQETTYYAVFEIAQTADPDDTFGLSMDSDAFKIDDSYDTIDSSFTGHVTFPLIKIVDAYAPDRPIIDVITEIDDRYSNDSTKIAFNWSTFVTREAEFSRLDYKVWFAGGSVIKEASIDYPEEFSGLIEIPHSLTNGQEYYIQVQAFSTNNAREYASAPGITPTVFVDVKKPTTPGRPRVIEPDGMENGVSINLPDYTTDFTISWEASNDLFDDLSEGSGLYEYVLEQRINTAGFWNEQNLDPIINSLQVVKSNIQAMSGNQEPETITYRVRTRDWAGNWSDYSDLSKNIILGSIEDEISSVSNFPNPFNSESGNTTITFILGSGSPTDTYDVTLDIYDLFGNKVWKIDRPNEPAGTFTQVWDGKNGIEKYVSKGGYICRISAKKGNKTVVKYRKIGVIH